LGSNSCQKRCGPRRRMIEPSVVRIRSSPPDHTPYRSGVPRRRAGRSRERRTGPHGVARVLRGSGAESSAALVWRSRQAVSAAFRYSLPHRGSRTVAPDLASLNLARPFRARDRRADVGLSRTDSTLPGFQPLQRMQSRGFGPRGLATPAIFRPQRFARSRRLTLRDAFRACFIPVALLGFSGLQGFAPRRGASASFEASCSRAVQARSSRAAKRRTGPRSSEH